MTNTSPWTEQVADHPRHAKLTTNTATDIVIVGGGIAGITNAYYLLHNTDYTVTLLEAGLLAHGATGHNAGQVVQYFERPFSDIAKEYGLTQALEAQSAIFKGWDLLEELAETVKDSVLFETFYGYAAVASHQQLLEHLENKYLRDTHGAQFDGILVDREWLETYPIPPHYLPLIESVDKDFLQNKLETTEYFPIALVSKKGCVNSALFSHELARKLLVDFPERFTVFEHSPVTEVRILQEHASCIANDYTVTARHVILCTNGYENFQIIDFTQPNADTTNKQFHKNVEGLVGYMCGYLSSEYRAPTAISYFPANSTQEVGTESYFYYTRRSWHDKQGHLGNLMCLGGPELLYSDSNDYTPETHDPKESFNLLTDFIKTYHPHEAHLEPKYQWHGLMGFTATRLRYIGEDPTTKRLWYNLGCNGVGILSSVYGSWKLGQIFAGVTFPPSVFDPVS